MHLWHTHDFSRARLHPRGCVSRRECRCPPPTAIFTADCNRWSTQIKNNDTQRERERRADRGGHFILPVSRRCDEFHFRRVSRVFRTSLASTQPLRPTSLDYFLQLEHIRPLLSESTCLAPSLSILAILAILISPLCHVIFFLVLFYSISFFKRVKNTQQHIQGCKIFIFMSE